jgi:hypothetical protein
VTYSLGQAAKAVGKSKPTISRAIAAGKISATRNPDNTFAIDPAELHRVFPPVPVDSAPAAGTVQQSETASLHREVQLLRETVEDLRRERDRLLTMLEQREQRLLPEPSGSWWRRWFVP